MANYNLGKFSPFVVEQVNSIEKFCGCEIEYFGIVGKGAWGYISNLNRLKHRMKEFQPDLIHAHYGLSGLLANLQRKVPVITTYHGSDIHTKGIILFISKICMRLSAYNIFVSEDLLYISRYKEDNHSVISCGVDIEKHYLLNKKECREKIGFKPEIKYVLFSGKFSNTIKNYTLARAVIDKMKDVELVELTGYTRDEVNVLMNACDALLVTSHRESGPLVVKEAILSGLNVVTVPVGDVRDVLSNIRGSYVSKTYNVNELTLLLNFAINDKRIENGKAVIVKHELNIDQVAPKVYKLYDKICTIN